MLKYYLTGLASSLLLLAAGSLAHQLSTGILLFALVSAAFCIFQIINLPFTQSAETLNEQRNSIKTVNDNNFNLLENRSNLFIEGHLHRLGYLLHLARPEKKSEFENI